MLSYYEERRRMGSPSVIYRVRSWYLFGFVLLYRRWEQLTVRRSHALPSEE